jgi:signal transduction histidine kinase
MADLNEALTTTVEIAGREIRDVADVSWDLGALPLVPCWLGDLNQVFLNLVVNAAHAIEDTLSPTHARGHIAIRSWRAEDDVFVTVTDDGCGIPEAIRESVFSPFFTTKRVGRGTGQGLAIALAVVTQRHGGALSFESEVGRGTTFTVRLPLAPS